MVHREPVIELIGVDPYKFAEIRSLGLINETIDWKQRFFVPTDDEPGIAVLTDLLSRYPILAPADSESEAKETEAAPEMPAQVVDLDEWIVHVRPHEPDVQSSTGTSDFRGETTSEPAEES